MKKFHNIKKCRHDGGQYVGRSADGRSWRIVGRCGAWSAYADLTATGSLNSLIMFERLSEISEELASIGGKR